MSIEWLNDREDKLHEDEFIADELGFDTIHDEDAKSDTFRNVMLSSIRIRTAEIKAVAISMKAIYVITTDKQALRWTFQEEERLKEANRDSMTELIIRVTNLQLENVFCDPTGWHCLVTMSSGDTHYFHLTSNSSVFIHKLHSFNIESVAWSGQTEYYQTREILLGTRNGVILEMSLEFDQTTETIKQHQFSRVIELPGGPCISGILYEMIPGMPAKYSVMAATVNCLFQFIGDANEQRRPDFPKLFEKYRTNPTLLQSCTHEVGGSLKKSQLQYYYTRGRADGFAWMSGSGLMYGKLATNTSEEIFVTTMKPVPFPARNNDKVIGIGMTAYHVYFLFNNALLCVSKLNQQVVHTIDFEMRPGYEMQGVMFDAQTHSLFAWSNKFIYQILIDNEDRDVWKYYIEQNRHEEAVKFCERTDSPFLPKVKGLYADFLFHEGKSLLAADSYAQSDRTFEEIALKLMSDSYALQRFLEAKLNRMGNDMKAQRTLLSTWLVEIHLHNINALLMIEEDSSKNAQEDLRTFLSLHHQDLDATTTYDLLQSHGRIEDWVYFAELKGNFELVMLHHMNQQEFKKALMKLEHAEPTFKEPLLYRYSPVFMKNEPKKTVDLLIELARERGKAFEAKKLLPALMNVEKLYREQAIRFEVFCINELQVREKSLHNLLIFHLAESDEEALLEYFQRQEEQSELDFDPEYALSVCKQSNRIEALIFLYSLLKMYSEAVSIALENNKLQLAKENAQKPERQDEDLSRRLWLQIAIHLIKISDVKAALEVMHESKLIKMEDLLPYFDESVSISNFKEDICKALEGYKEKIDELKTELDESSSSSQQIKKELHMVKQRFIEIEGLQPCDICGKAAMKRNFYIYPCAHAFHKDCLLDTLLPILKIKDYIRANRIQTILETISDIEGTLSQSSRPSKLKKSEEQKEQHTNLKDLNERLDQMLAPHCYLCGALFIESIRDNMLEDAYEIDSWSIN